MTHEVSGSQAHVRDVAAKVLEVRGLSRAFGDHEVLRAVSLEVEAGEIHALLGPNGAGKTTLFRILTGRVEPTSGRATVLGLDAERSTRALRSRIGLIPSGDRSFYLRISGLENLIFFGRLHGLKRREAVARAQAVLGQVGLADAARLRVGHYSHGMQKRLSVARALLTDPDVLLVDEATHDLDPEGARVVRDLVREVARRGAAVLWTTQRVDEIRAFADRVTLLSKGEVRFQGTVPQLMAHALPRRYVLRLRNGGAAGTRLETTLRRALGTAGVIRELPSGEVGPEHFLLFLEEDAVLGDALSSLSAAQVQVLACREERSEIEEAFLQLTSGS